MIQSIGFGHTKGGSINHQIKLFVLSLNLLDIQDLFVCMYRSASSVLIIFCLLLLNQGLGAQSLRVKPFQNKVFVQEKGQFKDKAQDQGMTMLRPILYAVENSEFNAYFTKSGISFQVPKRKTIPYEEREHGEEHEPERDIETEWHSIELLFDNPNPELSVLTENKVSEYYNYTGIRDKPNINFVPAFKKLVYKEVYEGIDLCFELPKEGGIKYHFIVKAGADASKISLRWNGLEQLILNEEGGLDIMAKVAFFQDKAPTAFCELSNTQVPIKYKLDGNIIGFDFQIEDIPTNEALIIDPWITNTSYPATNRAYDIQEDAAGNVVVHGNNTNYQVQKYSPTGVLQWTYVTNSTFLGDIAVDDPGNVYIVGGYSAGKRQKLNPAGVQLWSLAGLVEEWRLAFNYSKTVLTVGGYFVNPGGNNLARLDLNNGAISNQIVYGAETRAIATDCNGDMYSLHVTFGTTGAAASNVLRKTNANFTPGGSIPSGFLLAEAEVGSGYAPNPTYSANIFHGINGIVVSGLYVYIYDGATIRRVRKNTLTILNSATTPNGAKMMCSGLSSDLCGNIYAGTQNGIAKFDSLLNYVETINTPGPVYDIMFGSTGELFACGEGFLGTFAINCVEPPPLVASVNNACDGTGSVSVTPSGGLSPYTYEWQPGGQTTPTLSNLPAGVYTYTVNDAFCRTFSGSVTINENPISTFGVSSSGGNTNNNPNSVCDLDTLSFTDASTSNDGNIISWEWDFGDGNSSSTQNPQHVFANDGFYNVSLITTTDSGCVDTLTIPITVNPLPIASFTGTSECLNELHTFTDGSTITSGTITDWEWNFGDGNNSTLQNPTHTYNSIGYYEVFLALTSDQGCKSDTSLSNATNTIEVYDLPIPDFSTDTVCEGGVTSFFDESTVSSGSITSWFWEFGDGNVSNIQNPTHVYSSQGVYNVKLTVESDNYCRDSITKSITVYALPIVDFDFTNACLDDGINFYDQSTITNGAIVSWSWNFGDTQMASGQNVANQYASANTYDVNLIAISDNGCSSDSSKQVVVFPEPQANFNFTDVCLGSAINFIDNSSVVSGAIVEWSWNFGDGGVDSVVSPAYQYLNAGIYNVQLTVITDNSCVDDSVFPVQVYDMPVANFLANEVCESNPTVFTDNSYLPIGTNSWDWNFGDGSQNSTLQNPAHIYATADTHSVTLTVTADGNCIDDTTLSVVVFPGVNTDFNATSACLNEPSVFTDLSTVSSGVITTWSWEFGDNSTSVLQNPTHTYSQSGSYNVILTTSSDNGCSSSDSLSIAVYALPVAGFTHTLVCDGEVTSFTDQSTISNGNVNSWTWGFDDGGHASTQNPSHTYDTAGTFNVQLLVNSSEGCVDSATVSVDVYPNPMVDFEVIPQEGCMPLEVELNDLSTIASGNNTAWDWEIQTLHSANTQNTTYTFEQAGTYDASLKVTSDKGCEMFLNKAGIVTVRPKPFPEFVAEPEITEVLYPEVEFTDQSTGNPLQWYWQFGSGDTSSAQHPVYSFPDTGIYAVSLEVFNQYGCSDTVEHSILISPSFTIYVPNAFTPNRDGTNDVFKPYGLGWRDYELRVFNRWGAQVFESFDPKIGWDGVSRVSGNLVKPDVYVWRIVVVDHLGTKKSLMGRVSLVW